MCPARIPIPSAFAPNQPVYDDAMRIRPYALEDVADVIALHLRQGAKVRHVLGAECVGRCAVRRRESGSALFAELTEGLPRGQHHQALHHVAQLPHVAGPGHLPKPLQGRPRHFANRLAELPVEDVDEVMRQHGDVRPALA